MKYNTSKNFGRKEATNSRLELTGMKAFAQPAQATWWRKFQKKQSSGYQERETRIRNISTEVDSRISNRKRQNNMYKIHICTYLYLVKAFDNVSRKKWLNNQSKELNTGKYKHMEHRFAH